MFEDPLPWQRWGEELVKFGVWCLSVCGGTYHQATAILVDLCISLVHFWRRNPLRHGVRVSAGLQSPPDKPPLPGVEAGPHCLRACLCREELPCISPSFLPSTEGFFTPHWKGTKLYCRRALGAGQGKRGFCSLNSAPSAVQELHVELHLFLNSLNSTSF